MGMTKRERIKAAAACQDVDRVPYSLWYHFTYVDDKAGDEFIGETLAFARRHDIDFLKVMHDIDYDMPEAMPVIKEIGDWAKLEPLDVRKGNFGRHLEALKRIKDGLDDDRPIVDTVFHCFAFAQRIAAEREIVCAHMAEDPDAVEAGLKTIGETLKAWANVTIEEEGVLDGLFLAINGISGEFTTPETYEKLMMPSDRAVLQACKDAGGWFNVAHLHGGDLHFDLGLELPFDVLSWSDRAFGPSLTEARAKTDRCFVGGVNEVTGDTVSPDAIKAEVKDAIAQVGPNGLIVTCGCAFPTPTPEANLRAIREAILEG